MATKRAMREMGRGWACGKVESELGIRFVRCGIGERGEMGKETWNRGAV